MDSFLQIRISPEEKEQIKKRAKSCGMTTTDLIKESVKRAKPFTPKDKKIEKEKIREIAKCGNNLNQIARWCNTQKSTAECVLLLPHLIAIERRLKELATDAN